MLRRNDAPPEWVMPGAIIDADFANDRYWNCSISRSSSPSRSSSFGMQGVGVDRRIGCMDGEHGRVYLCPSFAISIAPNTGIWVDRVNRNFALYSRDFSNAVWVATNCTLAGDQIGNDENNTANAASRMTATSSNATCLQSITLASTQIITSAFVKRLTGTGTVELTQDGGSTWTDITSLINSNTWRRVNTAAQTLTDPQIGFRLATSGDAIAVDFFQTEDSDVVTQPLVTLGASQLRGTSFTGMLPQIGNLSSSDWTKNDGERIIRNVFFDTPASLYVEFSVQAPSSNPRVIGGADGNVYLDLTSGAALWGNTDTGSRATTSNTVSTGQFTYNKVTGRIGGEGCAVCLNGGAIATNTSKSQFNNFYSHIGLGSNGNGGAALGGSIKRFALWRRELDDGEMQRLTT